MKQWIVLYTRHGCEKRVVTALTRQEIPTFFPQIWADDEGKQSNLQPLFPNYLFALVDLQKQSMTTLRWTSGLRRIVSFAGEPAIVSYCLIDELKQRVHEFNTAWARQETSSFRPGEPVIVRNGPFKDLRGVFDRAQSATDRVRVLLHFLGKTRRVQLKVRTIASADSCVTSVSQKRPRRSRGRGRPVRS